MKILAVCRKVSGRLNSKTEDASNLPAVVSPRESAGDAGPDCRHPTSARNDMITTDGDGVGPQRQQRSGRKQQTLLTTPATPHDHSLCQVNLTWSFPSSHWRT